MSGIFGGSTTTRPSAPKWVEDILRPAGQMGLGWLQSGPNPVTSPLNPASGTYQADWSQFVAPISPYTQQGLTQMAGVQAQASPYQQQALAGMGAQAGLGQQAAPTYQAATLGALGPAAGIASTPTRVNPMLGLATQPTPNEAAAAQLQQATLQGQYLNANPEYQKLVASQQALYNQALGDLQKQLATQYEATGLPQGSLMASLALGGSRLGADFLNQLNQLAFQNYMAERGLQNAAIAAASDVAASQFGRALGLTGQQLAAANQMANIGLAGAQQAFGQQQQLGQTAGDVAQTNAALANMLVQAGLVPQQTQQLGLTLSYEDLIRQQQQQLDLMSKLAQLTGAYPPSTTVYQPGLLW